MNGCSETTWPGQGSLGLLPLLAVLVAVTWLFDLIIARRAVVGLGVDRHDQVHVHTTGRSGVPAGTLILTSFAVNVRPHFESPMMWCMA